MVCDDCLSAVDNIIGAQIYKNMKTYVTQTREGGKKGAAKHFILSTSQISYLRQ